jgi:hypothetical protein
MPTTPKNLWTAAYSKRWPHPDTPVSLSEVADLLGGVSRRTLARAVEAAKNNEPARSKDPRADVVGKIYAGLRTGSGGKALAKDIILALGGDPERVAKGKASPQLQKPRHRIGKKEEAGLRTLPQSALVKIYLEEVARWDRKNTSNTRKRLAAVRDAILARCMNLPNTPGFDPHRIIPFASLADWLAKARFDDLRIFLNVGSGRPIDLSVATHKQIREGQFIVLNLAGFTGAIHSAVCAEEIDTGTPLTIKPRAKTKRS